jgi:hypothetical protein
VLFLKKELASRKKELDLFSHFTFNYSREFRRNSLAAWQNEFQV